MSGLVEVGSSGSTASIFHSWAESESRLPVNTTEEKKEREGFMGWRKKRRLERDADFEQQALVGLAAIAPFAAAGQVEEHGTVAGQPADAAFQEQRIPLRHL